MSRWMVLSVLALMAAVCLSPLVFAQDANTSLDVNVTISGTTNDTTLIQSPFDANSRVCIFVREWILKAVFIIILLVFLTGVAVISGAAFPEWRNYGSRMILGSLGAVILYLIGLPALKFLMGVNSLCGL